MSGADLTLTAGQAMVRFLAQQYSVRDGVRERLIRGMFGIFGHGNVTGLGDALADATQVLPYHQARNEQAMVHAAVAFARKRNRRSTFACTSSIGPGAANMVTGAATATIDRLPVLLLPGDVYATRRQGNVLQQIEHPVSRDVSVNDCFRPVSRFFDRIVRPEQLIDALPQAMRVLTDPVACGAVTLSVCQDVGPEAGRFPARLFDERDWAIPRPIPDDDALAAAARLLAGARRPLIVAGGGAHYAEAGEEVLSFAERFAIPVCETFAGKGIVQRPSELLLGGIGVEGNPASNAIARQADVVLCIGTRLSDFITASRSLFAYPDVRFIGLNVDRADALKLGGSPLVGDAKAGLLALERRLAAEAPAADRGAYVTEVREARDAWRHRLSVELATERPLLTQGQVVAILNDEARDGDTVITAAGTPPGDLLKTWDATEGRHCQIEFGFSCMGHEIPGGLGVRLAQPDGEVFVYVGDGSYLIGPSEIVTAVQEHLKITLVIVDNGGFQVIRRLQLARTGRPFGNEFRERDPSTGLLDGGYLDIDLGANAASLGARVWSVDDEAAFRKALAEAREHDGVSAIVVKVDRHTFLPGSDAWWDAVPPAVSSDAAEELRAEYERGKAGQRFYG
jgi:3D-(3,5/4)-trihydroxycyclohexane-1,2-dione acylhydrolase (decyclizing)